MPYVIVKLWPGRSEREKTRLAEEIVKDIVAIAKCGEGSVSVAIEEIKPEEWAEKVYKPEILSNPEKLYKKPRYNRLNSTGMGLTNRCLSRSLHGKLFDYDYEHPPSSRSRWTTARQASKSMSPVTLEAYPLRYSATA